MDKTLRDCPYLGMAHDPQTKTSYPSVMNCCHHAKPVDMVELSYQQDYCLAAKYATCPVFIRDKKVPLPRELRALPSQVSKQRTVKWPIFLLVMIVILALVVAVSSLFSRNQMVIPPTGGQVIGMTEFAPDISTVILVATQPATVFEEQTASTAMAAIMTQTLTQISTITRTTAPTRTFTPTPTLKPTQTPTHSPTTASPLRALDTIIGKDHPFIIHKVNTGESLSQYANQYKTSLDAVLRVNYALTVPMWAGALVVIPVGFTDVAQMPFFQPSQVSTGGITIEALAIEEGTNLDDLIYYNDFKPGERLKVGDWILIPRPTPAS